MVDKFSDKGPVTENANGTHHWKNPFTLEYPLKTRLIDMLHLLYFEL